MASSGLKAICFVSDFELRTCRSARSGPERPSCNLSMPAGVYFRFDLATIPV